MSAYKTINLTEDHIKLLSEIKFESFIFDSDSRNGRIGWGIDQYAPWGGERPIEDIGLILGRWMEAIPGSEDDIRGRCFPEPLQSHLHDLYDDITNNMEYMWSLLIFYSNKGGLTPGTYRCHPRLKDWEKVEE